MNHKHFFRIKNVNVHDPSNRFSHFIHFACECGQGCATSLGGLYDLDPGSFVFFDDIPVVSV